MTRAGRNLAITLATVLAAGCAMGPDYEPLAANRAFVAITGIADWATDRTAEQNRDNQDPLLVSGDRWSGRLDELDPSCISPAGPEISHKDRGNFIMPPRLNDSHDDLRS